MASEEHRLVPAAQARSLDREIMEIAGTLELVEWMNGIAVRPRPGGNYEIELSQFKKLRDDLAPFESRSDVQDLYRNLESLGLTIKKPNYRRFKALFGKRIAGIEKPKVVFMLGAGASKPSPSDIPTINEMLHVIVEKLRPSENPMTNKIREWSTRKNITIEDIMTAGYLSSHLVSNMTLNRLVGEIIYRTPVSETKIPQAIPPLRDVEYIISFRDLVDRIFSIVSGIMIRANSNPVHDAIAKLIKNRKEDFEFYVLTTNYDVCIERALLKEGLPSVYLGVEAETGQDAAVPIVKIHGSINWFYCEGCQDIIIFGMEELGKYDKVYPTAGSCLKCNTLTELFMIPPIAYKYVTQPPIVEIWQSAMRILEEADVIVIVGYSFSLADDYILKMVTSGLKKRAPFLALLTNSPSTERNLEERLLAYHEKIGISLIEDSAISVPKISKIITDAPLRKANK